MPEFEVIISPSAKQDIRSILHYIAVERCEPEGARSWADALHAAIEKLAQFPERYPVTATIDSGLRGTRKMPVGNYLVFYRIHPVKHTIDIARVQHGHRNWKK